MRFFVAVPEGTTDSLAVVVAAAVEHEKAWWQEQLAAVKASAMAATGPGNWGGRRAAMAGARAERARRRAAGELLGSRDRLLAHAAATVLAAHGWDTDWPPVPIEAASTRGRPWGVRPADPRYEERLSLDLPDRVGAKIKAAAYWVSAEPTGRLREWYDQWGDGPGATDRLGGEIADLGRLTHELGSALGAGPHHKNFVERDAWRDQILTTGHILRLAVDAALTPPTEPTP